LHIVVILPRLHAAGVLAKFVLVLHAFANAAGVALAPLGDDDDLRASIGTRILTLSPVVLAHELLVLLVVLLLLVRLAHNSVLLLKGVVVPALELCRVVVSSVEAIIELALIARHLLIAVAATHCDYSYFKLFMMNDQFKYIFISKILNKCEFG